MAGITEKPWFRKFLVSMVGKPRLKEFLKASKNVKGAQETVLKKMINTSRDTAFGKDHGFDKVKNGEDFRNAVPISGFGRHRPYVERMCKGEADILFPGRPLFYNTTSGTTAKPKLIPVSEEYYKNAYTGISRLWLYTCMRDNSHIYDGKSLSAVSAAEEGKVEDGTPYGAISGVMYKNVPGVLKSTFSTPYPIICIKNYLKKYYGMMRSALESNITIIISPSPSNVLRFHQTVMENFSDLVKHIHDGTLREDILAEIALEDRDEVKAYYKPNHLRAAKLEKLMQEHGENLRPKHYWPNLALVNTWKQGNFAQLIPKLDGFFQESTVVRAFGYQASEGRAGLVLGNDWDYSVLAVHIYHFEFIEESQRFDTDPVILQAHEVEVGKRYYIFFSNGSGLFRYDINDIIEVTGHFNNTPLFKFIQKGEGITTLTGEKLSEEQVMQAIDEVKMGQGVPVEFYVMFCDEKDLCYKFFVEFGAGTDAEKKEAFSSGVDNKLRELNPEYEAKRGSQRLDAPLLYETVKDSYEKFKKALVDAGIAREGQYKDVYLTKKRELLGYLERLVQKN